MKKKVKRQTSLYEAAKMVYQGKGTFEEQNNAKYILYRNGIKKEKFNDPQTTEKIHREVVVAQQYLEEQQTKTKKSFFKQKELKKDLETLETAINGVGLANNPRFYFGDDFGVHIGFEQQPEHVYTSFDETADLTLEELENKADELVDSINDLLLDATRRSQKTDEGTEKDFEN